MRRRNNVLDFRRPKARRWAAPGPVRRNKLAFARRRPWSVRRVLRWAALVPVLLLAGMYWGEQVSQQDETLRFAMPAPANFEAPAVAGVPVESYADEVLPDRIQRPPSGTAPAHWGRNAASASGAKQNELVDVAWVDGDSGSISGRRFRLYGIDAPEGSAARAQCSQEQTRAQSSADAAKALTRSGGVRVSAFHGLDAYDRELVSLSVRGRDVATALIRSGHAKRWDYDGGQRKPDWCN